MVSGPVHDACTSIHCVGHTLTSYHVTWTDNLKKTIFLPENLEKLEKKFCRLDNISHGKARLVTKYQLASLFCVSFHALSSFSRYQITRHANTCQMRAQQKRHHRVEKLNFDLEIFLSSRQKSWRNDFCNKNGVSLRICCFQRELLGLFFLKAQKNEFSRLF